MEYALGEPDRLVEWLSIEYGVASALIEVECLRTLDRLRVRGALSEDRLVSCRAKIFELLETLEIVEISRPVLSRAASPFPTALGTLDAIHLSTALAYREIRRQNIAFTTHDRELSLAARSFGFETLGA